MKRVLMLAVLAGAASPGVGAEVVAPAPNPPLPSPSPAAGAVEAPTPSAPALPDRDPPKPAAGAPARAKAKAKPKPPTIRLAGEKREVDSPDWQGAGVIPAGKTQVKVAGAKLTAGLTAEAFSHSFFGVPSVSVASLQLAQEFEVESGAPGSPLVLLTLSAKLDGYVRSERHGAAALRLASAAVTPTCGGPPLWVALPGCRVEGSSQQRCEQQSPPASVILPAGRYVLVANLVLETDVGGFLRSHAEAVFAPGRHEGSWTSNEVEPPDVEEDAFGLAVTLTAAAPPSD